MSSDGATWGSTVAVRIEARRLLVTLDNQAGLTNPVVEVVERARTGLAVALMELADDPFYTVLHSDAAIILDRLADMLEDPALRLGW